MQSKEQTQQTRRLIRRTEVETKIGLKASSIYDRLNPKSRSYDPTFPRPVPLGVGKNPPVAWLESEIDVWIDMQIEKARSEQTLTGMQA